MAATDLTRRPSQITDSYMNMIDRHLDELVQGYAVDMFEIEDFAKLLFIHPIHLSNTIKETTGTSPCGIYQYKILEKAKKLLATPSKSIHDIALTLTFEPSQFTKWFKRFCGITPKQYRRQLAQVN